MTGAVSWRRLLVDRYFTIDARSLGLGRIGLALVLLFDLLRRIPVLTLFYSNQGLLPNHTLLWRPPTPWMFSFFFLASLPGEAAFCFVLCGLVYLALLVGWRTRLMQFLSLCCVLSLHGRVTLLENGGDWMLGELALWTAFLPLGRRFSVDAVRASLRQHPESTPADLTHHAPVPGPSIAPEFADPISSKEPELRSDELIAGGAGPTPGADSKRVREDELGSDELLAGGAGPSQGPDSKRVGEAELRSGELIAGGAGPSQGADSKRVREDELGSDELLAEGAGPTQGADSKRVREDELRSDELIAGGAGPSQGPDSKRVGEAELGSDEPTAGGAGPSQGPDSKRVREDELGSDELLAGGAGPSQGPDSKRVREDELGSDELLAGGAGPSQGPDLVVSLAAFALVLQLAISYFFNAIQKGGPTWRHGSAVHYVIYQNRMVTWFGVWMRGHMSLGLSRVLSYSALATEGALPALLLLPLPRVWTRRAAILAILGLHVGFQCFINLGVFSWAMIGYTPFLLTAADWELFARLAARRGRRLVVYFDAGCGVCFQLARVLARLDVLQRIRFVSGAELGPAVTGPPPELLARTIVAEDCTTGGRTTRADAVGQILRALPAGWLWSLPFRLPGSRALANLAYDAFARRRQTISVWLGLPACGLPGAAPAPSQPDRPRAPVSELARRAGALLREGAVLAMMITLVSEALFINQAVPRFLKFEEPGWIKRLVAYPRLIQAWSMFASDAPLGDQTVVVEAITIDGRHVDPYSEVASRYRHPGIDEIPIRLDNNSFFFNYTVRIPDQAAYHQAFLEWILAYPKRTHRPTDSIVRFDAYSVENDSPPPGETRPNNLRRRIFLSYPPRP